MSATGVQSPIVQKALAQSATGYRTSKRIVPIAVASDIVGLSESTIRRLIDVGDFPRPVQMTLARKGFIEGEIVAWLENRIAMRDDPAARAAHPVLNGSIEIK